MKQTRLIDARNAAGFTQENVAQAIGISRSFYTQIEQGTRKPSFEVALKISSFFKRDANDIFLACDVASGNKSEQAATLEEAG